MTGFILRRNINIYSIVASSSIAVVISLLLCVTGIDALCGDHRVLMGQAEALYQSRQYDSALALAEIAKKEAIDNYGANDTSAATVFFQMAEIHNAKRNYDKAAEYWSKSLAIREYFPGVDSVDIAHCLYQLGLMASLRGHDDEAESLYVQTMAMYTRLLGAGHSYVGRTLNRLANIKMKHCKYPAAEDMYRRATVIIEQALGPDDSYTLRAMQNLGLALMWQRKYKEAYTLFQKVVESGEKDSVWGPDGYYLHYALHNLSLIHRNYRELYIAESLAQRSIAIITKAMGADHPDLCVGLLNLGDIYRLRGNLSKAEETLKHYLELKKRSGCEEGIKVASAQTSLASVYYDLSDSTAFMDMYQKAKSAYEEAPDFEYNNLPRELQRFSWHFRPYDIETSLRFAARSFEIRRRYLLDNYVMMSEYEALRYAVFMRSAAYNYLSCYFDLDQNREKYTKAAADIIFASKGQVSDEIFARHGLLMHMKDPGMTILLASLARANRSISELYAKGPSEGNKNELQAKMDSLFYEKGKMESEILNYGAGLRKTQASLSITADSIARAMPDNSVLIEYLRFYRERRQPDTGEYHYIAVVLDPESPNPVIKDLGEARIIDEIVSQYRQHVLNIGKSDPQYGELQQEYRHLASTLYAMLWRPIEEKTSDGQLVFIAPDGNLNLISFAGLIDGEGRYLIETSPIHYLFSGRDAIRLGDDEPAGHGLLLFADPDYDADAHERELAFTFPNHARGIETRPNHEFRELLRRASSECDQLSDIMVDRLPASRTEAEQIVKSWRRTFSDSIYYFLDNRASEDNLKIFASGKRVIHLATHGFYIPTDCLEKPIPHEPGLPVEHIEENPLMLSGLFFAGANQRSRLADSLGIDDGILTAGEVSFLDLTGVELVMLSACESGLGEFESGEGVFGLRRAFQMAGAGTVISSLWPVGDRSAAEFMAFLYQASGLPLYRKIRQYQKDQIERLRDHGYSDHPYQWAAFMATGDWRR